MTERRTVGDLDPDREVWVLTTATIHKQPTAHLSPDCRHVGENHREKPTRLLFDNTKVCKKCDGIERADNGRRKSLQAMIADGDVET